jgi:PAS domain S-box-containing protein
MSASPHTSAVKPVAKSTLLASIVDSSEDAIIGKTLDGTVTSWNPAAARLYGYEAAEIVGRPVSLLMSRDKADEMTHILGRISGGERVEHYETIRIRKDGSEVPIALTVSPIRDEGGHVVGASSIARDITERNRADLERRVAAQYARSLIEASLDPLVTISPEGKVTDVNEATAKVTGILRERLIGTDFSDYFTEPEEARKGYLQVFAEGSVTDYPLTIRHRDGQLTDVVYNASVYRDAGGQVLGVFAAARDVTAQKAASQYARSLIEASLDPLVTISPEGKVTDVNEATAKVTGISRERLIGTDFSDYFTEPEEARKGYLQVFAEGSVTDYPLTIRHRDGQLTDVVYNASVYRDAGGQVLGVFAAARDMTAQKRAEAEIAEQRSRELERLADLERFQKLTVGRELKMIELKKEIVELRKLVPSELVRQP